MGGSNPDLGLGSSGSLGISGAFGGPGTGNLGLLGDVPPMGGPDFGLPGAFGGTGLGDLGLLGDVPPTGGPVFGLPGDAPDTGLDAGDLLPVLDGVAGEESATKYCDAWSRSWLSSSN